MMKHELSVYGICSLYYTDEMMKRNEEDNRQYVDMRPDRTFVVDMFDDYGRILHALENDCENQLRSDDVLYVYVPDMVGENYEPKGYVWGTDRAIRHFIITMYNLKINFAKGNWRK